MKPVAQPSTPTEPEDHASVQESSARPLLIAPNGVGSVP